MKIGKTLRTVALMAGIGLMMGGAAMAATTGNLAVSADIANTCTLGTINALNFGTYDPVVANASTDLPGQSTLSITCTNGDPAPTIALGLGQSGVAQRVMSDGADSLNYNLYSDSGLTTPWDDTSHVFTASAGTGSAQSYTVYGNIPHGQNVAAGHYTDTVVVTVTP